MNAFEKKLFGELLDQAIQELSNNGCNDLTVVVTAENRSAIAKLIKETAYDEDEIEDELERLKEAADGEEIFLTDFIVMQLFRDKVCGKSDS